MQRKSDLLLFVIVLIIGLTLGYCSARFINFDAFELDNKFSLTDLVQSLLSFASLIATIWIAIYITTVLEKNQQTERIKKDLILKKIEKLESLLIDLNKLTTPTPVNFIEVTALLKQIDTHFSFVKGAVARNMPIPNLTGHEEFRTNINELRNLVTYYPPSGEGDQPTDGAYVKVVNGKLHIPMAILVLVEGHINKLSQHVFQFQLEVNSN